ncbi:thiol:disulfide interchange protein [Metabacillus crassostreae]|uniref:hypothetical protein n=1 Tax=Metabacillus crassostreae TaxID=929098 RepID=UPI001EF905EC|nr:hypothetical protein [Metabacillus crassostreae]MBM7602562.1 thiol:disulfide interchange protein [Metabacillus crassostreae]
MTYSKWSIIAILFGLLSFGLNWIVVGYYEPIVLIGALFLLIGALFSFIAISRKEKGRIKYISLTFFFIILFLVTWYEPFQFIRILTWLKNIT